MRSLLIKRPGRSEDSAGAAVFLWLDEADCITGVNLPVDGGWMASGGLGRPDPDVARIYGEAMAALGNVPTGPQRQ